MTEHKLVCEYFSPLWPDSVLSQLWDYARSLLQDTKLSDNRRRELMRKRCDEIRERRFSQS